MLTPSYLDLHKSRLLKERVQRAHERLSSCAMCPRRCGINRLNDERGFCRTGLLPVVSSYGPHFGEEPPLVGSHGSGTIFFAYCNMDCAYCQNYSISQEGEGRPVSIDELAAIMLALQDARCHNINLVSPTHVVPQILAALETAVPEGLKIPLVYNTGTCDSVETLALLDGVVDIYMPDAKYGHDDIAVTLSGIPEYTRIMRDALHEMHRQVGDLVCIEGIAVKGLIIRHLVLPDNLADSAIVMKWIAEEISKESYVNIMGQYRPAWRVREDSGSTIFRQMRRTITKKEFRYAIECARKAGLHRGFEE
jgi:putative pyruvate formate lyase activating enzyme